MTVSFEDLDVWKRSCRLCVKLYELLRDCREWGIKDQMLRASVSIPSNIAEGSERKSVNDFKRFINIALGSAFQFPVTSYRLPVTSYQLPVISYQLSVLGVRGVSPL